MRSLKESISATVDLGVILMIVIAFAGLVVIAYIIWEVESQLNAASISFSAGQSVANVTGGFDDAVNLLLVAITIFILAIAISALLMLRGR